MLASGNIGTVCGQKDQAGELGAVEVTSIWYTGAADVGGFARCTIEVPDSHFDGLLEFGTIC